MTTNYHTAITTGAAANASVVNSPLSELDSAIAAIVAGAQQSHYDLSINLPGLASFFTMASVTQAGLPIDETGNLIPVSNGDPTFETTTQGQSYIALDGTGDYLSRNDSSDSYFPGTESFMETNGATFIMWVYPESVTGTQNILSKWTAGAQEGYLFNLSGTTLQSFISDDGSTTFTGATGTVAINTWQRLVFRFTPSVSLDVFVNTTKSTVTAAVPASIHNSTAQIQIGASAGTDLLTGRISSLRFYRTALSDTILDSLYTASRTRYGV